MKSGEWKERFAVAQLVRAKAGHDRGHDYLICAVSEDERWLWLVDGAGRRLSSPKRKNAAHVQPVQLCAEELAERIAAGTARDEEIKHFLSEYQRAGKKSFTKGGDK